MRAALFLPQRSRRTPRVSGVRAAYVLWLAGAARIAAFVSRTKDGQSGVLAPPNYLNYQEHPVVVPHVMHLRHVPLRTMVNWPQSPQESPS